MDATSPGHPLRSLYDTVAAATHDRWTALTAATQERVVAAGDRLHQATELAAAQKVAAVAASTVALTGGGIASDHGAAREPARATTIERQVARPPGPAPPPARYPAAAGDTPPGSAAGGSDSLDRPADADGARTSAPAEFGPELSSPGRTVEPNAVDGQPAEAPRAPMPPSAGQAGPGAFER
jgi:hypothetical protein